MPWKTKRLLYLVLAGCAVLGLGVFVAVRNRSIDTELLGISAALGGLVIIFNALTANGNGKSSGNGD
jgi:hypothetical protein